MFFMTKDSTYKITLEGGPIKIDKMEIDSATVAKIVRLLTPLSSNPLPEINGEENSYLPAANSATGASAKEFIVQKQPKNDIERVVCLAYYLTHNENVQQFKTVDLTHLNVKAAQPKLSNPSATARNAATQNFLAPAGGGKKQITPKGEALVGALPDRGAVKRALEKHFIRRKRKGKASRNKKSSPSKK
jgi:hypothetical protein